MYSKWLDYNIYKKLWSLIGGRPWTYILRDIWHRFEWFPQMEWYAYGALTHYAIEKFNLPWWVHFIPIALYTHGYIKGHIHWGTKYEPGQKGQ